MLLRAPPYHYALVAEAYSLLLTDREPVSGGIFNQSGSVFYRISPENSLLEIQLGKLPAWLPVCYERWNSSLGTLVCRQLGYLRSELTIGSGNAASACGTKRDAIYIYFYSSQTDQA